MKKLFEIFLRFPKISVVKLKTLAIPPIKSKIPGTPRKNLEYFHSNRINWVADKGEVLKNLFFEYETSYGNFIIIKPNGQYFYYLGEFGKQHVLRYTRKFLK